MNYFYNIEDLIFDCIDFATTHEDHAVVICGYETALEIVNSALKYTDFELKEFDSESIALPFIIDFYYDNEYNDHELWVVSAINNKGRYMAPVSDHVLISTEYVAGFKADHPDTKFIEFKYGPQENEKDYAICLHENGKGFCFCRALPDGEYTFSYQGNKELTEEDIYNILKEYGKVLD